MTRRKGKGKPKLCGARKKQGPGTCARPAGWGTAHPGRGRCKLHGGRTQSHQRAAEREAAAEAVALYGLPREVGPQEALLEEVYRTAGHVAYLGEVVQSLEARDLVYGITRVKKLPGGGEEVEARAAYNVWLRLYHDERDRLVRVARAAVEAGVAERAVELAEQQAAQLAQVVSLILTDLGHDLEEEETRKVVRLRLIEGGRAA